MANFCLPRDRVNAFKLGLKSGEIDPQVLSRMSSEERRNFLAQYVGDGAAAKKVNAEFESKLLLKNQQLGMITWAKKTAGLKPQTKRDLITRIQKLDRVLDPEEQDAFLSDLAEAKLGFGVAEDEAKTIAGLSKTVSEAEAKRLPDGTFPTEADRMKYGYAVEDMTDYVASLKKNAESLKASDLKTARGIGTATSRVAGNLKSLTASLDNSSIFRQGWKTLITNPNIWRKNAAKTFSTLVREVGGKNVMREVNADIVSRPTYDKMTKAGLAIKNPEEAFPESAAEKIPGFGRLYKASESAYTGFVYKTRADVFDQYLKVAEKAGVNIDDPTELKAIGKLVNSLTGRGDLGALERVATPVNNLFFSPRFVKANLDTLTAHALDKNITPFARKQAAKNLLKVASASAGVLYTANALLPGSVDWDSRSTDFGKIRVGNTRFDVTGGMGSLVVLMARLATGQAKTSTGKMVDLKGDEFGGRDQIDVFTDFIRNKLAPASSLALNVYTGKDFLGRKTEIGKEVIKATTPIGAQNAYELLQDPNSAPDLVAIIAEGLGISASNYAPVAKGTWENSSSKQIKAFKESVGQDKFNEAAKQFEDKSNEFVNRIIKDARYKALSDDDKQALLTKKKNQIRDEIMSRYNFTYKTTKKPSNRFDELIK